MLAQEALIRTLRGATLLFLSLPLLIFFGGWLRIPLAVIVDGALLLALWRAMATGGISVAAAGQADEPAASRRIPVVAWVLSVAIPAAVLTVLSGAGGWGSGDSDWLKHDTILRDLLERTWPVTYESGSGPIMLVYYVAFYLPAALAGKLAGGSWVVASQVITITTFLGIFLAGSWLMVLARAGSGKSDAKAPRRIGAVGMTWIAAAIFVGFSGLDAFGKMGVNLFLHLPVLYGDWNDVQWWAQFAQYSANAATVFWAPQHAFGGWLPMALVLDDWWHGRPPERCAILYVALALAWSPFAAVGLIPVIGGLILWRWWRDAATSPQVASAGKRNVVATLKPGVRRMFTWENLGGVLAGATLALFLAAHFEAYPIPAQYRVTPGFHPMPLLALVPRAVLYLVFVALEFAGLSIALAVFFHRTRADTAQDERSPADEADHSSPAGVWRFVGGGRERAVLVLASAVLLGLPWFRFGFANDLVMRGGIPALFALQVLLARMFAQLGRHDRPLRGVAVALATVLLVAGWSNTYLEYRRHVVRMVAQQSWRDRRTHEPVQTLAELHRTIYARPGFDFARQYLGSAHSVFARFAAARRGALRPDAPPGRAPDF